MIIIFVQISQSPMSTTVIALVTVLACVLVSHTVMVIIVIVMCFVLKKNKRDVQEHIYDSVVSAVPAPTTHALWFQLHPQKSLMMTKLRNCLVTYRNTS